MGTSFVSRFHDLISGDRRVVGGKAANLATLARAGFDVPPGFCVTCDAYSAFLEHGTVGAQIGPIVARLDYDPEQLEVQTAQIRSLIQHGEFPADVRAQIEQAHQKLGADLFVAVRSSGTAEDLAEASFAGLHDTYLDVRGIDAVLAAVRRCWASMWTSRATAYRNDRGFDHFDARLCVIVQSMIPSDVSGVMFTGNPMTTATDEIVINASWGLGEAIVSGVTDPDTYVIRHRDLTVKEKTLGDKELLIRRSEGNGGGTATVETPTEWRTGFCLSDGQAGVLADLGRRIEDHFEGFPQDVEWALHNGEFYVLQSRPITGVEFSWDADVEDCQNLPHDDTTTWTRSMSDEICNGVITPLHYSIRWSTIYSNVAWPHWHAVMGLAEAANMRAFKYRKAEVYYNADIERIWVEKISWKGFRPNRLYWLPEAWHEDVLKADFSLATFARIWARLNLLEPNLRWNGMLTQVPHWRANRRHDAEGLSPATLRRLSDRELVRHCESQITLETEWNNTVTPGFFIYYPELMNVFGAMLATWYTGSNEQAFVELVSGSDVATDTQIENATLSRFAETIRNSAELSRLFAENENGAFFTALEGNAEGRVFLTDYQAFLDEFGHRGHADRDFFYARRSEDPSLDYRSLKIMLSCPPVDLDDREQAVNRRRAATYDEVVTNIAATPLGQFKAGLFGATYRLLHRFIPLRDMQRSTPGDLLVMSQKKAYREIGRRMVERGLLEDELDVLYLTRWELYRYFEGAETRVALLKAKIAGRKRDVHRFDAKEIEHPMYLRGDKPVDLSLHPGEQTGLVGVGTSPGTVVGVARVVTRLGDIGRVNHGEILVTHSTDPGWTPVFLIIKGVVVETGGLLAHASCLAREYGFPAVQLKKAMAIIPDGALIEIDGTSGRVTVIDEAPDPTMRPEGCPT